MLRVVDAVPTSPLIEPFHDLLFVEDLYEETGSSATVGKTESLEVMCYCNICINFLWYKTLVINLITRGNLLTPPVTLRSSL